MKFFGLVISLVTALTLFSCAGTYDDGEDALGTIAPPLMKLEVRDFVTYERPHGTDFLLATFHENKYREDELGLARPSDKRILLTEDQSSRIKILLEAAVANMPFKDDMVAPDGGIWILESRMYQEVRFSIWSPDYETEERGYTELLALFNYLSKLETLDDADIK